MIERKKIEITNLCGDGQESGHIVPLDSKFGNQKIGLLNDGDDVGNDETVHDAESLSLLSLHNVQFRSVGVPGGQSAHGARRGSGSWKAHFQRSFKRESGIF